MNLVPFVLACLAVALPACVRTPAYYPNGYPEPNAEFAAMHPAYPRFKTLQARHAKRAEVEHAIARELRSKPERVVGKAGLLAVPPAVPPTPRALALIERWPNATFAQLTCDVRVVACFGADARLVAYELF